MSEKTESSQTSQPALSSRLIAEFVGTYTLLTIGIGSILMFAEVFNNVNAAGLVGIAFAHGLAIAVMVCSVGHISGAHFNPAVTISMLATGRQKLADAGAYIAVQMVAAFAGAMTIKLLFPSGFNFEKLNGGIPSLFDGVSVGAAIGVEAVATFFLVWVIFATAVDKDGSFASVAGLPIGLTIVVDILMCGPITGAAMNPARWFGPALATNTWENAIVWIAGPLVGALAGGFLYMLTIKPRVD